MVTLTVDHAKCSIFTFPRNFTDHPTVYLDNCCIGRLLLRIQIIMILWALNPLVDIREQVVPLKMAGCLRCLFKIFRVI